MTPALSRMAGSAPRKSSIWASVMTSGGASRITSGAAALTRNPASRAAALDGLGGSARQHDAAQQPATADVVDQRMPQRLDAVLQRLAEHVGPADQIVVGQHAQDGQRGGRADRVAAERAAVQAGRQQIGGVADAMHAPIGSPPPSPLASVTMSGVMPSCWWAKNAPVRPDSGLHLVEHQQRTVLGSDLTGRDQVAGGRDDDAALPHDRFEEHRGGVVVDRRGAVRRRRRRARG